MKQVQTYKIVKDVVHITDKKYIERFETELPKYYPNEDIGWFKEKVKIERAEVVELVRNQTVINEVERNLTVELMSKDGYTVDTYKQNVDQPYQVITGRKHLAIYGITPEIEEAIFGKYKTKIVELKYDIERMEKSAKINKEWYDLYKKTANELENRVIEYNKLPWYRRIWRKV